MSTSETVRIIILCFGGIFTFAFGLAWIMPMVIAGQDQSERKKSDVAWGLMDLILILLDCFPIFWLFRAIPEAPSAYRAARETWKKETSIRTMFWLSTGSLLVTLGACFFPD